MSVMIDRVAAAMWSARLDDETGPPETTEWHQLPETSKESVRQYARSALKAMIEPTPDMLEAVGDGPTDPRSVWVQMLTRARRDD